MRTSKYIKLHQRCLDCLEMIREANNRYRLKEIDYRQWKEASKRRDFYSIYTDKDFTVIMAKYQSIKARLTRYYADVFQRLQSEVHEFITPKENIGELQLTAEQTNLAEREQEEESLRVYYSTHKQR